MDELLQLVKENNEMLKYIVEYIKHEKSDGQMNDFIMNVIANQINLRNFK